VEGFDIGARALAYNKVRYILTTLLHFHGEDYDGL
jgi:hypothetical protein